MATLFAIILIIGFAAWLGAKILNVVADALNNLSGRK